MSHDNAPGSAGGPQGEWSSSLWNCCPPTDLCLGWCCPCILYSRTVHRQRDPTLSDFETFTPDCKIYAHQQCWTGCGWVLTKRQRTELREKYGIPGTDQNDGLVTFCCLPCVAIQNDREVKLRALVNDQGYQLQAGMKMPGSEAEEKK